MTLASFGDSTEVSSAAAGSSGHHIASSSALQAASFSHDVNTERTAVLRVTGDFEKGFCARDTRVCGSWIRTPG